MDRRRGRRGERGTVMVIAALAVVTLLLFAGLALDVGSVWSSRGQSQHVADASALAAAGTLLDASGAVSGTGPAEAEAILYAGQNGTIGNTSIVLAPGDVTFGRWNVCQDPPAFDAGVATAAVNAVQVDVPLGGGAANAAPPTFFAGLLQLRGLGFAGFEVNSSATAYLGYEGAVPERDYGLPLAIVSCNALGDTYDCCESDACGAISGSMLLAPELQNACWTGFDEVISEAELLVLIQNGGSGDPDPIEVDDDLELLAGPLTEAPMEALEARLAALPPGERLVVKLPVVGCASGGGNPCVAGSLPVTGSICFEVENVLEGPPKQIEGHFLCADDLLFSTHCRSSGVAPRVAGGCNYGIAADRPVLVQ